MRERQTLEKNTEREKIRKQQRKEKEEEGKRRDEELAKMAQAWAPVSSIGLHIMKHTECNQRICKNKMQGSYLHTAAVTDKWLVVVECICRKQKSIVDEIELRR